MKKFLIITIVILAMVSGVRSQIKSDFDKSTDFTSYSSYHFEGWEKNSDQVLNDFDKKRITDALKSEFEKHGMKYMDSGGDAAVTLYMVVDKKSSTTAYTDFNGGLGYGGRWGWGWGGAGMGSATTTYSENDYKEGTLVVDMYDTSSKSLIWQGVITTVVKEKPEQRDKSIPKKIGKLMDKFPK